MRMPFCLSKTPFGRVAPVVAALSICAALMSAPPSSASAAPTETVLHAFTGGSDGATPTGGLIFDGADSLCGTIEVSGASNDGVAFQLAGTGFVPPRLRAVATANAGANSVPVSVLIAANPAYVNAAIFDDGTQLVLPYINTATPAFGLPPWANVVQIKSPTTS